MSLHFIGLGLHHKDITHRGLETIRDSDKVFLENYTSKLYVNKEELEEFYDVDIIEADRDVVEKKAETILDPATEGKVSFLVIGDPFGATTHADLFLRAKKKQINVEVLHNASILNVVGRTGLQLYNFGKTPSIVFDDNWLPKTPYDVLKQNQEKGLHTLFLLDIKRGEPSREDLKKGKKQNGDNRYMTVKQGIDVLEKLEDKHEENVIHQDMKAVGLARLGQDNIIRYGTLQEVKNADYGGPLHSLIIPGDMHEKEEEMLNMHGNIIKK